MNQLRRRTLTPILFVNLGTLSLTQLEFQLATRTIMQLLFGLLRGLILIVVFGEAARAELVLTSGRLSLGGALALDGGFERGEGG